MAQDEIERRFLVKEELLPNLSRFEYVTITQGYLPEGWADISWKEGSPMMYIPTTGQNEVRILLSEEEYRELESIGSINTRVRVADRVARRNVYITTKIKQADGVYREFEYQINSSHAIPLLSASQYTLVKVRTFIPVEGTDLKFEVDRFLGKGDGILIAEIELPSLDYEFERPEWLGKEITKIKGMSNFDMAKDPDLVCGMIRCIEKVQPLMDTN